MTSKIDSKGKIQIFSLLIILMIFPLISWYYLKQGFDYQKKARAELKDYGKLPEFKVTTLNGNEYNLDSLDQSMSVISFLGKNEQSNTTMLTTLKKLHTQFEKSDNLKFLVLPLEWQNASVNSLKEKADKYELYDPMQLYFLSGIASNIQQWLGEGIKVPKEKIEKEDDGYTWKLETGFDLNDYPYFVLVDTAQTIRNYYNYNDEAEVKRMVEHIAIILPKPKDRDAIIRRDMEK